MMHMYYIETEAGINFTVCLDITTGICSIAMFDERDGDFDMRFFSTFASAMDFVNSLPDN
jgi:CHASE1-domain containing sensor protein